MKQSWLNGFSTVFNSNTVKVIVRQPFSVTVIVRDPSSVSTERNLYGTGFTLHNYCLCSAIDLRLCCTLQIYVCVVLYRSMSVLYRPMTVLYSTDLCLCCTISV